MKASTPPFKQCRCCGRTFSQETWNELRFVGQQVYPWKEIQEMRNCYCGSTLAIVLEEGEPEEATA